MQLADKTPQGSAALVQAVLADPAALAALANAIGQHLLDAGLASQVVQIAQSVSAARGEHAPGHLLAGTVSTLAGALQAPSGSTGALAMVYINGASTATACAVPPHVWPDIATGQDVWVQQVNGTSGDYIVVAVRGFTGTPKASAALPTSGGTITGDLTVDGQLLLPVGRTDPAYDPNWGIKQSATAGTVDVVAQNGLRVVQAQGAGGTYQTLFSAGSDGILRVGSGIQVSGNFTAYGYIPNTTSQLGYATYINPQATNVPSSITLTTTYSSNLAAGMPTAIDITVSSFMTLIQANAVGVVAAHGNFSTVGNTLLGVDASARTFEHHCDGCNSTRSGVPFGELAAHTLLNSYAVGYACPTCAANGVQRAEWFNGNVAGALTQGYDLSDPHALPTRYYLARSLWEALGFPVPA